MLKFDNLKVLYSYMFTHPGKKMLFMGQDVGSEKKWDFSTALTQKEFDEEQYTDMKAMIQ